MKMNTRVTLVLLLLALPFTWYAYQQDQKSKDSENQVEATNNGNVYERPYSPSFGPDNAKVTIVEFFDPACSACRAFYPIVKEIMSRHESDIRLVLRYAAFHQGSDGVIRILEASRNQGLFKEVLEALLVYQEKWTHYHQVQIDKAWKVAGEAGLDINKAQSEVMSEEFTARLEQEKKDIAALKVSKTPTFFVNEQALPKFGGLELYELVKSELDK